MHRKLWCRLGLSDCELTQHDAGNFPLMADYYGDTCVNTRRQYLVDFFPLQDCKTASASWHTACMDCAALTWCSLCLVASAFNSPVLTHLDAGSQGSLLECWSGKYATQVKQYDDDVETAIRAAWCASAALHIVKTCFVVFCSQPGQWLGGCCRNAHVGACETRWQ